MRKIISIGILCAVLVLTGCKNKTFTVTFDSQGGSPVAAITNIIGGEKIIQPADPTKDGFGFGGWYKETSCKNAWNFASDVVNSNITLYAKWIDGFPINAQVKNGNNFNALVSEVRAIVYGDEDDVVLAKAPYQNGGFKMTLPATVDANLLYTMSEEEEDLDGMIISDPNVKFCWVDCFEAYKNEEYFDDLIQVSLNTFTFSMTQSMYMYADRNVTITGTVEDEEGMTVTYNMNIKKGWNVVYASANLMTYTMTLTTTPPIVLPEWWFEEDFSNSMPSAPQKSPKMFKKFFK